MRECSKLTGGEVIAIGGQTVRGSYRSSRGLGAIYMVNAFAKEKRIRLDQHKVYKKVMRQIITLSC